MAYFGQDGCIGDVRWAESIQKYLFKIELQLERANELKEKELELKEIELGLREKD